MTDTPLSGLPPGAAIVSGDLFYSVQGGISVRQPASALAAFLTNPLILPKTVPAGVAPGAGFCSIQAVAGTIAGTCKIIIYAGTSNTPVTIVDNVGAGF